MLCLTGSAYPLSCFVCLFVCLLFWLLYKLHLQRASFSVLKSLPCICNYIARGTEIEIQCVHLRSIDLAVNVSTLLIYKPQNLAAIYLIPFIFNIHIYIPSFTSLSG